MASSYTDMHVSSLSSLILPSRFLEAPSGTHLRLENAFKIKLLF